MMERPPGKSPHLTQRIFQVRCDLLDLSVDGPRGLTNSQVCAFLFQYKAVTLILAVLLILRGT